MDRFVRKGNRNHCRIPPSDLCDRATMRKQQASTVAAFKVPVHTSGRAITMADIYLLSNVDMLQGSRVLY